MRQPLDFIDLERNVTKLEKVLKNNLIYNIHGHRDTKGIQSTFEIRTYKMDKILIKFRTFN